MSDDVKQPPKWRAEYLATALPAPTAADLAEAVLLFHSGGPWTSDTAARWHTLTGVREATTKTLCDLARAVLGASR
jgi:hypothetical protein